MTGVSQMIALTFGQDGNGLRGGLIGFWADKKSRIESDFKTTLIKIRQLFATIFRSIL